MGKGDNQKSRKNVKKAPLKTKAEKKAEKIEEKRLKKAK